MNFLKSSKFKFDAIAMNFHAVVLAFANIIVLKPNVFYLKIVTCDILFRINVKFFNSLPSKIPRNCHKVLC